MFKVERQKAFEAFAEYPVLQSAHAREMFVDSGIPESNEAIFFRDRSHRKLVIR